MSCYWLGSKYEELVYICQSAFSDDSAVVKRARSCRKEAIVANEKSKLFNSANCDVLWIKWDAVWERGLLKAKWSVTRSAEKTWSLRHHLCSEDWFTCLHRWLSLSHIPHRYTIFFSPFYWMSRSVLSLLHNKPSVYLLSLVLLKVYSS